MQRSPVLHRRFVVATMIVTCMLFGVDQSMTSVALPSVRDVFSVRNEQLSWIVSSYVIAFMAISPAVSWLCRRFGRREVFCANLAIMAAADAFCASTTSFQMLITLRIIQGATMGVVFPLTLSNLIDEYAPEQHSQVIAYWTTAGWMGPIVGTVLAGIVIDRYEWRGVFVLQAAICAVVLAGSVKWTRGQRHQPGQKLDIVGLIAIVLAIVTLQLLLMRGVDYIGTASSKILMLVFFVSSLIFASNLRRNPDGIVNPKLFADENFRFSIAMLLLLGFEIFSISFVIPLMLADVVKANAIQISILALPRLIGTAFGAAVAGKLNRSLGFENLSAGGFALIGFGSLLMLVVVETAEPIAVIVGGVLYGFGVGIASTALGIIAFATLPKEWRDEGAALRQLLRIVGGTFGISLVATIINRPISDGANNYFGGFVLTTIVGFFASAIVLLRWLSRAWHRSANPGATTTAVEAERE
jgi:DHA2 family multidrug resistance protein